MPSGKYIPIGSVTGAKAQNAEFFAADLTPSDTNTEKAAIFQLTISLSAAVVVEVTYDSGSNWTALNSGTVLGADQLFEFDLHVRGGDTFNIRIPTAGGATVDVCRVDESRD